LDGLREVRRLATTFRLPFTRSSRQPPWDSDVALRDEHHTTSELEKCSAGTQAVGRKARLELVFAERQGRTILEHARVESPLKITRPYYPENTGTAQLILMSPAPGIFGGDDWTLRVRVKAGAWVQIAPQGALRVHPAPEESPARQRVELFVEAGADLHWEMEPAIPFRDSVLHQQVCIHLEPEARLFYWEAFCSGRVRHGESWEFKELRQDLQCWRGDELLLLDRYRLCPQGRSPNPGYAPARVALLCQCAGAGRK